MMVNKELQKLGLQYSTMELGMVELNEGITAKQRKELKSNLLRFGLELLDDKRKILIERIKYMKVEMIH